MSPGPRLASPRFVVGVVSGGHFLSHFYYLVFPPLFPLFRLEFDVSNTQLGLLFSLLFLMPSILQVPVGDLVDRWGAKPLLVVGIALTGAGTMATALADSYLALLGFVLLAGVGQSVFHPADYALIESVTDAGHRGKSFGSHTFAGMLGFAAGPVVAGGLGVRFGWRTALASLGAVAVAYAVAVQFSMRGVHGGSPAAADAEGGSRLSNWSRLAEPPVPLIVLFFVLATVGSTGIQSFTVVFLTDAHGLGVTAANTTLTVALTATALGVLAGGVLADRFSFYRVLGTALTVAAAVAAVIAAPGVRHGFGQALALFVLLGGAYGVAMPSRDSLVTAFSPSGATGKSFALAYTGVTVGAFVSPVMLGFVSDTIGDRAMFGLIGGFFLATVLTVVAIYAGFGRDR